MARHYLEIVTPEVDATTELYRRVHGLRFGEPDPDLGQARVASCADGSLVGVRAPLAAHEQPIVRMYVAIDDIENAAKEAQAAGAMLAYGPAQQGKRGSFAILSQGGAQHGLWQP